MLTPTQIRVLGCLVEKQLTTPQQYPLTENALIAACNQSTNRDPVVSFDANVVRRALVRLREHGLAREVHRPGERAAKHRHLLDEALEIATDQVAVLAVLMLRGPQTAAELRTRTERMHPFPDVAGVEAALERLASHPGGALAERQERRPGQKEARYAHLLLDPMEDDEAGGDATPPSAPTGDAPADPAPPRMSLVALTETIEALRAEVAALRAEVAAVRAHGGAPSDDTAGGGG
jgi:uncharacterized protein